MGINCHIYFIFILYNRCVKYKKKIVYTYSTYKLQYKSYIDRIAKTWSLTIHVDCKYIKMKQPNIGNIILEF